MDLSIFCVVGRRLWLPRTRGDGPGARIGAQSAAEAPPHTRGWTPAPDARLAQLPGSPAHAGMDLRIERHDGRRRRLPRTRGDGPWIPAMTTRTASAPPHTRGWTWVGIGPQGPAGGSPAHAGMDLAAGRRAEPEYRLPRTRGDGPDRRSVMALLAMAPPHTRGWTQDGRSRPDRVGGSPAHAGMDPPSLPVTSRRRWLPRTRGDGPFAGRVLGMDSAGSPAHAGMDPTPRPGSGRR